MGFKIMSVSMLLTSLSLVGCTKFEPTAKDRHLIGEKLQDLAPLNSSSGIEETKAVIFDPIVRVIHQFDLVSMVHEKSFRVDHANDSHSLLHSAQGGYILDISEKKITLFLTNSNLIQEPIHLAGLPTSASFRPELGLIALTDDSMTVGLIKISSMGSVVDTAVLGPIVSSDVSIDAGDILSDGRLILSLSDSSVAIVDMDRSISEKKWIFTTVQPGIGEISWIAGVRDSSDQVILLSSHEIVLYQLSTNTKLGQIPLTNSDTVQMLNKRIDPHLYLKFSAPDNQNNIVYAQNSSLHSRNLKVDVASIAQSELDLNSNTLSLIAGQAETDSGAQEQTPHHRKFYQLRFSDMSLKQSLEMPDSAHLEMNGKRILALFNSDMGFAVSYDTTNGSTQSAKFFNVQSVK